MDGEGGGGGEECSDREGEDRGGREVEVRAAAEWESEEHEDGGEGDLESAEAARGELRGGVCEGEQVRGEGERAEEGEPLAEVHAGEELGASAGCAREKDEADEGEDGAEEDDGVGLGCCGRGDAGDQGEDGDEDDDEAGEEGGLRRRGVGEAGGLEGVAEREEEAGGEAEAELRLPRDRRSRGLRAASPARRDRKSVV